MKYKVTFDVTIHINDTTDFSYIALIGVETDSKERASWIAGSGLLQSITRNSNIKLIDVTEED